MTTIVTRAGKGSPLTHTEVDTNFTNLNTAKLETAAIPLGTLQAPSVSFLNDSDTGIFCPQGGNSLAIATGGQYAITCTSTQAVGIKTANPQGALHVAGSTRIGANDATDAFLEIGEGASGNRNSYIDIVADTTYTDYGLRIIRNNTGANATSELKHRGTGALNFTTQEAAPIVFNTTNSPALTILAGGNVGIGTTTVNRQLVLNDNTLACLALQNSTTGNSITDGFQIQLSGTDAYIWNYETAPIIFGIASSECARIRSDGMFEVKGAGVSGSSPAFSVNGSAPANSAIIDTSGRLLIGTSSNANGGQVEAKTATVEGGNPAYNKKAFIAQIPYATTNITSSLLAGFDGNIHSVDLGYRYNGTAYELCFATNSTTSGSPTERMRITNEGWFKASNNGTYTYAQSQHEVRSNSTDFGFTVTNSNASPLGIQIYHITDVNSTGNEFLTCYAGAAYRATLRSNGGLANYSANNANLSDRNAKKDIAPAAGTWSCVKEWEIVNYRYKEQPDDADLNLGVIAQQVAESCPEVITIFQEAKEATEDKPAQEERLGVKEQQMYWMAIKALQEAMERIEQLETEMTAVKAQLA